MIFFFHSMTWLESEPKKLLTCWFIMFQTHCVSVCVFACTVCGFFRLWPTFTCLHTQIATDTFVWSFFSIFSAVERDRERENEREKLLDPPVYSDRPSGQSVYPPASRVRAVTLCAAIVRVVRLVVHHQLIVHKVEAVGLRIIRVQDHLSDCEWAQKHYCC